MASSSHSRQHLKQPAEVEGEGCICVCSSWAALRRRKILPCRKPAGVTLPSGFVGDLS